MNRRRSILAIAVMLLPAPGGLVAWSSDEAPSAAGAGAATPAPAPSQPPSWRHDPLWHQGKAEWAVYDAVRPIYGTLRRYQATIFTNRQHMDPATTTKAEDWRAPGSIPVFKHNVSEMVPTERYTYRFLTTCFVRSDTLVPHKLVVSTQEDCGSSFKRLVVGDGQVDARQFVYFPGAGDSTAGYRAPSNLAFHDALTLTLRDYPFHESERPAIELALVPDQTDTHVTRQRAGQATVTYVAQERISVPYGDVDTHHLRVEHDEAGGTTVSDYWFAADVDLRHVLVKYQGPYGVRYELQKLAWWAYWSEPRPQ